MPARKLFKIKGTLEIEKDGETFLNQKRLLLLKLVKELGSIKAASREMKMSYQQAWHFIKDMNRISPLPLVVRQRGGTNGGGAVLTKYGEKTVVEYERLLKELKMYSEEQDKKLWLCFF